jgi:hypothetical protein
MDVKKLKLKIIFVSQNVKKRTERLFIFNIQPARANKKTLLALQELSQNPVAGLTVAKDAIAFSSPHVDDIRGDIARTITDILGSNYKKMDKNTSGALLAIAYDALKQNVALHPADVRTYLKAPQLDRFYRAAPQSLPEYTRIADASANIVDRSSYIFQHPQYTEHYW